MSTPETLIPKPLSIPEFAARIRAKHPKVYDQVDDTALAAKVARKYPKYYNKVDFGDPAENEAALATSKAQFDTARASLQANIGDDRSPLGHQLNPDVVQPVKRPKLGPNEEGIVSLASDSDLQPQPKATTRPALQEPVVSAESLTRPRTVAPPVSLQPVIQSRLDATKKQNRQRDVQRRVAQARAVREKSTGKFAGVTGGVSGYGSTIPDVNQILTQSREQPAPPRTFAEDRAQRVARQKQDRAAVSEIKRRAQTNPDAFGAEYKNFLSLNRTTKDTPNMRQQFLEWKVTLATQNRSPADAIAIEDAEQQRQQRVSRMGVFTNEDGSLGGKAGQIAPGVFGGLATAGGEILKTTAMLGQAGLGRLVFNEASDNPLYKLGATIEKVIPEALGSNPDLEQELGWGKLPAGAGNMIAFLAGGAATKGSKLAVALLGAGMEAPVIYEEIKAGGGTENEALAYGLLGGAVLGSSEIIGFTGTLNALKGTAGEAVLRSAAKRAIDIGGKAGKDMVLNAVQEVGQTYGEGLFSGKARSAKELKEAGLLGGVLGGVTTAATQTAASLAAKIPASKPMIDYAIQSPLTSESERAELTKLAESGEATQEQVEKILRGEEVKHEAQTKPKPDVTAKPTAVESTKAADVPRPTQGQVGNERVAGTGPPADITKDAPPIVAPTKAETEVIPQSSVAKDIPATVLPTEEVSSETTEVDPVEANLSNQATGTVEVKASAEPVMKPSVTPEAKPAHESILSKTIKPTGDGAHMVADYLSRRTVERDEVLRELGDGAVPVSPQLSFDAAEFDTPSGKVKVRFADSVDSKISKGKYIGPEQAKWEAGKHVRDGIVIEREAKPATPKLTPQPKSATSLPATMPAEAVQQTASTPDRRVTPLAERFAEVTESPEMQTVRNERRKAQEGERRAEREAQSDALTGLANQRAWRNAEARIDADPSREVIAIDLKNFKLFNDPKRGGEAGGDAELQRVASTLKQVASEFEGAQAFRKGGDEFRMEAPKDKIDAIKKRIAELNPDAELDGLPVGLSMGSAATSAQAETAMKAHKTAQGAALRPSVEQPKALAVGVGSRGARQSVPSQPKTVEVKEPWQSTAREATDSLVARLRGELADQLRLSAETADLAAAIEEAIKTNAVIQVATPETITHERFHRQTREISGNKALDDRLTEEGLKSLTNDPIWEPIEEALFDLNYQTTLPGMVDEAFAYLSDGHYEMLGISKEESDAWLTKWFAAYAEANGFTTPREFQELSDEAKSARDAFYAQSTAALPKQQRDSDVSSVGEGPKERSEESAGRDRERTRDPDDTRFARERGDPWTRLADLADDFERIANEPDLPAGQKPLSLPKTLDAAGLESGPTKGYTADAHIAQGAEDGKAIVAEKGVDGAMEFVRNGDGIAWASTGFEVSAQLRAEEARLRAEGKTEEADATQEKKLKFLDDFALAAVERGRSIVGIKAVAEFSPDRMAYMLNKISLKKRKRGISPEEDARIAKLGEELGALEDRNKALEKALEAAKAQASQRTPKGTKPKKSNYQSRLDEQAQIILQTLRPKVGRFDFAGLKPTPVFTKQEGKVGLGGIHQLPGDAELIAQYAASRLATTNTVVELNDHLLSEFGQEIEPFLPKIRQRAYGIRQEARLAEIEAQETEPKRRKTILAEIQKEIAESLTVIREAQKAQDSALKAERRVQATEMRAEARTAAKQAREQETEAKKQIIKEARADLKRLRDEMKAASQAETKGYRDTISAQKEAARRAELWDTPLRNEAAEARERLKSATDVSDPETMADLVSVAAEKFLPDEIGGQPRKAGVEPAKVYRDLKAEFPNLVTKKNQGKIYQRGYQRIQDMTAAAREAARMRSASAESKRLWDELGIDVDAQAVLIKQAEVRRQTDELRRKAVAEFNRVSRTLLERVWMEVQAFPRSLLSAIDAPLGRQGVFFLLTHPIIASKSAVPATLKGYGSIHVADFVRHETDLTKHPKYDLALRAKLDLSQTSGSGDPSLVGEEQFQSPLAARIFPHVRLSEQGYVLGMNAERLAIFDRLSDLGLADGYTPEANMDFFEAVARFVNVGTGRGDMPNFVKQASAMMNFFFFSTRLNISRIQLLNDLFNPVKYVPDKYNLTRSIPGFGSYDPVMRKIMAQELLRLAASLTTVYMLAHALGAGVEFDPEDPDALLLRVRNTRYDITGGEAGTIRFLYRFLASIYKTANGEDLAPFEEPLAVAGKFLRYKLAPFPSGTIDALTGKDAVGNPANLTKFESPRQVIQENVIIKRSLPILTGNVIDSVAEEGWLGLPMALPALAGFGVSSYPDRGIRAIKNQKVVDTLEELKINSQSLIGQKTKDDDLDESIQKRILERVENLKLPEGTDIGKETLIREQLGNIRALAKAETALAEPEKFKDYLVNRAGKESFSFLSDEDRAKLTEADVKKYRGLYADAYLTVLKNASKTEHFSTLSDENKAKLLDRVGRIAHNVAKGKMKEKR